MLTFWQLSEMARAGLTVRWMIQDDLAAAAPLAANHPDFGQQDFVQQIRRFARQRNAITKVAVDAANTPHGFAIYYIQRDPNRVEMPVLVGSPAATEALLQDVIAGVNNRQTGYLGDQRVLYVRLPFDLSTMNILKRLNFDTRSAGNDMILATYPRTNRKAPALFGQHDDRAKETPWTPTEG